VIATAGTDPTMSGSTAIPGVPARSLGREFSSI
jgi:hypothetical protein